MSFEGLQAYMGWKSTKVFFKHYSKQLYEVKRMLVAAGKVVKPAS